MSFLLWILGSLLAISFIGNLPWIGLLLTGLTGIGMGLSVHVDDAGARLALCNLQHRVSQVTLKRAFPASVFNVPMMAFLIMLLLSLWVSPDVTTSFGPLVHLLVGIAVFYILSEVINNSLAGGLIPILSIATALFLNAPFECVTSGVRGYIRLLFAIALMAMFAALPLTQSRGGIVAMGVVLLFLITSKRWWIGGILIGTLVLLYTVADNGTATSHGLDLSHLTGAVDGLPNREEIWWRAVFMLQRAPYTGIGLGVFSHVVPALYPMLVTEPQIDLYRAHNLYLQVGVDLGIPGLAAFISILVVELGVTARRVCSARHNHWTDQSAVSLGLDTGLIAIILTAL